MLNDRANPHPQTPPSGTLYRHGDVLLKRIDHLPRRIQKKAGVTLAHGEVTGHRHRIEHSHQAQLWSRGAEMFLEVRASSARLIHEEHRAIELPRGLYRVWKQREYRPGTYVDVED